LVTLAHPPARGLLEVELSTIPVGTVLSRCHPVDRGELEFNPTAASGRFRPTLVSGAVVPTIYAGVSDTVALWESVFHDIGDDRPMAVPSSRLDSTAISRLQVQSELTLAVATDPWVRKWRVTGAQLSNAGPTEYAVTAEWATAIYHSNSDAMGIAWMSRQLNTGVATVLWEDRVPSGALAVARPARPLSDPTERRMVLDAATSAGITVVLPE
jgi:hypothetical protein